MRKKDHVKVKIGLIEDPKHRTAMGDAVWLYLHIIKKAEYATGDLIEWKDEDEAMALAMPLSTLRYQRKKLEQAGYVTVKQRRRHQDLTIQKWIDPRLMGRREGNNGLSPLANDSENKDQQLPAIEGDNGLVPLTVQGSQPVAPEGSNELSPLEIKGDNEGHNNGNNPLRPTSLYSPDSHIPVTTLGEAGANGSGKLEQKFVCVECGKEPTRIVNQKQMVAECSCSKRYVKLKVRLDSPERPAKRNGMLDPIVVEWFVLNGSTEKEARAATGKIAKQFKPEILLEAVVRAGRNRVERPYGYLSKIAQRIEVDQSPELQDPETPEQERERRMAVMRREMPGLSDMLIWRAVDDAMKAGH